jgi:hypothetical protein
VYRRCIKVRGFAERGYRVEQGVMQNIGVLGDIRPLNRTEAVIE